MPLEWEVPSHVLCNCAIARFQRVTKLWAGQHRNRLRLGKNVLQTVGGRGYDHLRS